MKSRDEKKKVRLNTRRLEKQVKEEKKNSFSSGLKKIQFHHKLGHQSYLHLPSILSRWQFGFFLTRVQQEPFLVKWCVKP